MELFNNSIVLGKEEQFLLYQPYCGLVISGIYYLTFVKVRFYIFFA